MMFVKLLYRFPRYTPQLKHFVLPAFCIVTRQFWVMSGLNITTRPLFAASVMSVSISDQNAGLGVARSYVDGLLPVVRGRVPSFAAPLDGQFPDAYVLKRSTAEYPFACLSAK